MEKMAVFNVSGLSTKRGRGRFGGNHPTGWEHSFLWALTLIMSASGDNIHFDPDLGGGLRKGQIAAF
jgi:hypothetical protein